MSFVFFTSIEFLFAFVLILEIKNKQKLIDFEDRVIRRIRRKIRRRVYGEKVCKVCESKIPQELKKSA